MEFLVGISSLHKGTEAELTDTQSRDGKKKWACCEKTDHFELK